LFEFISRINEKYSILLNRAPTLHRFGIQAFDPVIILGQAIHLHPLVVQGLMLILMVIKWLFICRCMKLVN
jgi:DNA-directed RNA polymerase subunit beta'